MGKEELLKLLRSEPEGYISGERISAELGVSRAAVWKQIESLRKQGYTIESVTGKGYRLSGAPDALTREEILPYLRSEEIAGKLICLPEIDSTNNYAKRIAMQGAESGTAILADMQTGGRGRQGRAFQSPAGSGIYLTMLYRPEVAPMNAVNFTAYTAVAVCRAIERAAGVHAEIKWTNDIVCNGRKLVGILTEMSVEGESGTLQYLITGIGINVKQRLEDFPPELRDLAGSVAMMTEQAVSRAGLAAEVINSVNEMYEDWLSGRGDCLEEYRSRCVTLGKEVRIIRGKQEEYGTALDVLPDYSLQVRYRDGHIGTVSSGEVSVRGMYGYI